MSKKETTESSTFANLLKDPEVKKYIHERAIDNANRSALLLPAWIPPAPLKQSRARRAWDWLRDVVSRGRLRLGSWIAGVDLDDHDDWGGW